MFLWPLRLNIWYASPSHLIFKDYSFFFSLQLFTCFLSFSFHWDKLTPVTRPQLPFFSLLQSTFPRVMFRPRGAIWSRLKLMCMPGNDIHSALFPTKHWNPPPSRVRPWGANDSQPCIRKSLISLGEHTLARAPNPWIPSLKSQQRKNVREKNVQRLTEIEIHLCRDQ